jgi:hypothetical protein
MKVLKTLIACGTLFLSSAALRADVFAYSYTGTTAGNHIVSGAGDITATADGSGGFYTITALSGTQNNIDTSLTAGLNFFYDGSVSFGTFDFLLQNNPNGFYALGFSNGSYSVAYDAIVPVSTGTFTISKVPEAATLTLLLSMGMGVWLLARKLPLKSRT